MVLVNGRDAATAIPDPVLRLLGGYRPQGAAEQEDVRRVLDLIGREGDPWLRATPLHLTASALVIEPDSGQVLLRWHQRQQAWLQVGGHADPGESDPLAVALREAQEETGLSDLMPWPDGQIRHVVIVTVPAGAGEPAHEHADVRFVFATTMPATACAERPDSPLRWLGLEEANKLTSEDNLRETLARVSRLLGPGSGR